AHKSGRDILFEGAQGTLLDVDHGTYPFVTSCSTVAGGACTGAGIGPSRIGRTLGVTKAYATRVGGGPFPTELCDEAGSRLRERGAEVGSVTGRPRRTGWLDTAALRYARRVNGLDGLVLTKLDVLTGMATLKVCVAYEVPWGEADELPVSELASARPVYHCLAGWSQDIGACRALSELPPQARAYLDFVQEHTEICLYAVSVGPRREDTILLRDPFA
ncbi:MAG: adenylosuccinate synthetase, partial [Deltaproteobacteria bacterium]|nr:adenylosuccinate synthetase [Deltaproteobacteria bacterium]